MNSQTIYKELLSLTKNYLLQEYSTSEHLIANRDDYIYFLEYAKNLKARKEPEQNHPILNSVTPIKQTPLPLKNIPTPPLSKQNIFASRTENPPITPKQDLKVIEVNNTHTPSSKTNQEVQNNVFKLDSIPEATAIDISDIRKIIKEQLPRVTVLETPPNDLEAKNYKDIWKQQIKAPQIIILSFDEIPNHLTFLTNMERAINHLNYTTCIKRAIRVEQDDGWDSLLQDNVQLVIGSHSGILSLPKLNSLFRESPKNAKHFLRNIPLLILSDITFYLNEPTLKIPLWKTMKELLHKN